MKIQQDLNHKYQLTHKTWSTINDQPYFVPSISQYARTIHTVKPRKFEIRFSKHPLIRNKFGPHWIQSIGPIHGLFYNMFWVRKRNVSLRCFFNVPKICLVEKMIIIIFGVMHFMSTSLYFAQLTIRNK